MLVDARGVSKKYSLTYRHMLRYGLRDIVREFGWGDAGTRAASLAPGEFWALRDVSFQLGRGEALAIIGRNGAGKSTLLRLLGGLIKPDAGRIAISGRVGLLTELGTGMNPALTGRENVYLNASLVGHRSRDVDRLMDGILDFAGLDEGFIDAPMQTYSSGMWVRLAYAVAAHLPSDLLLVDEVLAVGDLPFQQKCIRHMTRFIAEGGSLVLVSHANMVAQTVCQRALLLDHGIVQASGESRDVVSQYFQREAEQAAAAPDLPAPAPPPSARGVVVESVTVTACADGGAPRSGDDARITVRVRAAAAVGDIGCAFAIQTGDQMQMITGARGPKGQRLPAGPSEIACTIPRLPLVPGLYSLRFVLEDTALQYPIFVWGVECPPTLFRVTADPSLDANLAAGQGMYMTLDARWDVVDERPA